MNYLSSKAYVEIFGEAKKGSYIYDVNKKIIKVMNKDLSLVRSELEKVGLSNHVDVTWEYMENENDKIKSDVSEIKNLLNELIKRTN